MNNVKFNNFTCKGIGGEWLLKNTKWPTVFNEINEVRCGFPSDDVINTLKTRVIAGSVAETFQQLRDGGQSPVISMVAKGGHSR